MDTIVTPVTVITLDSTRIVHNIKADLVARYFPPVVRLVQYDQSLPVIAVSMMQNGQTYTLPSGAAANIRVHKPDATYVYNPALGCDSTRNIVYFEVSQAMAAANGDGLAIVEIVVDGDIAGSSLITLHFEDNPVPEDAIESSDEWETIYELGERIIASTVTPVSTAAGMTDHNVVYLYTGTESGWNQGHMYYYNGTTWVDAGIAVTDTTLSVAGLAADAKATGDEISDLNDEITDEITALKEELGDITSSTRNLLNGLIVGEGIDGSGGIAEAPSLWYYTDYIPAEQIVIKANGNISGYSVNVRVCEYDSNKTFLNRTAYYNNPSTHTPSSSCAYIRISFYGLVNGSEETINSFKYQAEYGNAPTEYVPHLTALDVIARENVDSVNDDLENLDNSLGIKVINRFNKTTASDGYYVSSDNGALVANESYFASDFVDIGDLESVDCSYTHIIAFYNNAKAFISGQGFNTVSADSSITKPENAKYMRFSTWLTYKDLAQVGWNVSRLNYVACGKYALQNLVDLANTIIVDASGNGDYTSFTRAVYENVDSGTDILVKAGTYDIKVEYIDLFGSEAVNAMADSDTATFNGFQYGVILRNRKVEFASGAHLVCDWTGHTSDGTHRFCPLRIDYNAEIIGLHLVATATYYAIHDDYGLSNEPFTVKYDNCYIEGVNLHQTNCIGGGCRKYSRHILKNCYLTNNVTGDTVTARYHNTADANAEPEVYISNCYFNGSFTARWYGNQTTKMKVYVNNCEARSISKKAEDAGAYNVDNVTLLKWCNTETNPT